MLSSADLFLRSGSIACAQLKKRATSRWPFQLFRRADAAQVCNNVGVFVAVDGHLECSLAKAARQTVSERWRKGGGLTHQFPAATSAFDSTKRRTTSRLPSIAEEISGVIRLQKSKRMNFLIKQILASKNNNKGGTITRLTSCSHQLCTAAKTGELQGCQCKVTNPVECFD